MDDSKLRIQAKYLIEGVHRKLNDSLRAVNPWAGHMYTEEIDVLCELLIAEAQTCFEDYCKNIRKIPGEIKPIPTIDSVKGK